MRKISYKGEEYELINVQRESDGTFVIFVIDENDKLYCYYIEYLSDIEILPKAV